MGADFGEMSDPTDIANLNHAAVAQFGIEEFAALAGKLTDQRRKIQLGLVEVEPVNAPLVRCRIVHPQRLTPERLMRRGRLDLELLEIRVGIQKLPVIANAVIVDPGAGARIAGGEAGLPIDQPAQMRLPVADQKLEIMRSAMDRFRLRR